ncbi:YodD family peroxide/acid resistance protein [Atlantibacter sp.]|uniref:YodD family peroxide/acid resistance protein n=1 Tax=Atlantibacter sp. TaxID=1903473 RepID=UPI0028AAF675|nr:YodD family peroxide/acid resistance protein [Atlantibacter sp.]
MKTVKEFSDADHREVEIDVDALLAAINQLSESEVRPVDDGDDTQRVSVNGHDYHTYSELAEAFELDIHDFSVSELNR